MPAPTRRALLAGSALALLGAGRAWAGPDPREVGLSSDLLNLERIVGSIDGRHADVATLGGRVWQLHTRLIVIEGALGLHGGLVSRLRDWRSLTLDVTLLSRRVRAMLLARVERAHPASDGVVGGVDVPAPPETPAPPPPTAPKPWPPRLPFNATCKLNFEPFGTRLFGTSYVGGWEDDFLQEGVRGTISFALRARGLLKQMASARVRVVVRLLPPFAPKAGGLRVYDVDWVAERALSDNALKNFLEHETLTVHGPYRWIRTPEPVARSLAVEAHVLSLTNAKGETITFDAPQFVRR